MPHIFNGLNIFRDFPKSSRKKIPWNTPIMHNFANRKKHKKNYAMKKNFILMAAAMIMAVPTFFTSCDEDPWNWYGENEPWWYDYDNGNWGWNDNYYDQGGGKDDGSSVYDEAEVLQGEWDGKMTYTNGDTGEQSSFYANMTFVRNSSNDIKGTGTEIDYTLDSNGNVDEQNSPLKFNWYIDESTGDIHIKYLTTNKSAFVMDASASEHGFWLEENNDFKGYMIGTNNNDMIYIDLKPVKNNEAKKATRALTTTDRNFGSNNVLPINTGKQGLTNRR